MTGGGTGGHLYPALAVAEALKKTQKEIDILFVGSTHGIESREVPETGFRFQGLDTRGLPRRGGLRMVGALWSLGRATWAARRLMREFSPHVVFSTGGYASAPVVAAAWMERLPLVLHEQNSVPGLTNRIACRAATEVHLAFASARISFPRRGHLRLSGNPLREQVTSGAPARALRLFRLEEGRKTILVFGGSQGAHSINQALMDGLSAFDGREDLQFLIQSGNDDYEPMLARCREVQVKTWVRRFISNMGDAYALADLVVCRAGAMTISELAACGRPAILIPFPHAAGNHQMLNAEQMVEGGAALLVPNSELTGRRLAEGIEELLSQPRKLREMSVNALRMARPDAAEKIARSLLKFRPPAEIPPEPEPVRRTDYRSRGQAPKKVGPSRMMGRNGARSEGGRGGNGGGGRSSGRGPRDGGGREFGSREGGGREVVGRDSGGGAGTGREGGVREGSGREGGGGEGGARDGGGRDRGGRSGGTQGRSGGEGKDRGR